MNARVCQTTGSHIPPWFSHRTVPVRACTMSRRIIVGLIVWGFCLAWVAAPLLGQDNWGARMFDRLEVDFGAVAKGADVKQRLKLRNIYQEDIQITSAQSSCACFRAAVVDNATVIPSGKTVEIEIGINTLNYQRKRDATLTVQLYEPTKRTSAEVRIPLKAYIRVDVVCTPGACNFGNVDLGTGAKQLVKIAYAGRNDWQIQNVKSSNPHLETELKEISRGNGLVNYELMVALKPDSPAGPVRDQLTLITDDPVNQQVPLLVHGLVEADITLTPDVLAFGTLTPGQSKTMNLVVRAKKPITIEKIEREKSDESFRVRLPQDARPVHVLPITFIVPNDPGTFDELFTITIGGRSEPLTFRAQGKIISPVSTSAN